MSHVHVKVIVFYGAFPMIGIIKYLFRHIHNIVSTVGDPTMNYASYTFVATGAV